MKQHERAVAMRLPTENTCLTVEGLETLQNITMLSMEAVNEMNAHGRTPSEMVAIIRELRETLKVADCSYTRHIAKDVLAKTEDFA